MLRELEPVLPAIGFALFTSFVVAGALVLALAPLARAVGLVDHPGGRKHHSVPTPLVGGIAILFTFCGAVAVFMPWRDIPVGLLVAAATLSLVGVLDDKFDLPWYARFGAQALAAMLFAVIDGTQVERLGAIVGIDPVRLGTIALPFTIIATIGVINALNMADGVDGLAGTLAACALIMLAGASAYAGNASLLLVLLIAVGALGGFLMFNLRFPWQRRARVFLGNSGSELLGLLIAWGCFKLTQNFNHPVSAILAPFLLAVPLVDCIVLLVRRVRAGQSPFAADRNHLHHLMLAAGYTATEVVAVLGVVTLAIGLAAAEYIRSHLPQPILLFVFSAMVIGYFITTHNTERAIAALAAFRFGPRAAPPVPIKTADEEVEPAG